ncbi:MerR family transcriptional regulator [Streptomyces nanshensis]|uniref:MerR family transcriptional regulator n=1 Tax=Streptomyces nanshensis TaxID=518642 RepID=UPI000D199F5C|nr:MerR family transcriptional regulator [Streptomyces nanshensis]
MTATDGGRTGVDGGGTGSGAVGTVGGEHRIEDLARHSGTTVRTIRAYQDRGLLPRPGRRGRANVYDDAHLTRLRQISALLERGYTLASIKELLEAWDEGRGLSGVLGLVSEVEGPWTDEEPERLTRAELDELFGGSAEHSTDAVAEAAELGVLVPLLERPGEYLVPSPQELSVAAELHRAGVPLLALTEHLRELRAQVEHIAVRLMEFTGQHVFGPRLDARPTDEQATEAAGLVRRLRPLAQQTVDAELARAMRTFASRRLREHLRGGAESRGQEYPTTESPTTERQETERQETEGARGARPAPVGGTPETPAPGGIGRNGERHPATPLPTGIPAARRPAPAPETGAHDASVGSGTSGTSGSSGTSAPQDTESVPLPARTLAAVRELAGADQAAAFIAAAAEREVQARTMDRLTKDRRTNRHPAPAAPAPPDPR